MIRQAFHNISHWLVQRWRQRRELKWLPLRSVVPIVGLAIAALALWLFAEIADEVLDQETQAIDQSILLALYNLHTPLLNQIMLGITFVGDPLVLSVLSLTYGIALILRKRWADLAILAIAVGGAVGLNTLLKDLFGRSRPELWERVVDVRFYSFPSGHAMISLVVYGLLGYWLATRFRDWQTVIYVCTIALIGLIGLSRLYLGVHWPTDVAAGFAAGLVWLLTCILSVEIEREYGLSQRLLRRNRQSSPQDR